MFPEKIKMIFFDYLKTPVKKIKNSQREEKKGKEVSKEDQAS